MLTDLTPDDAEFLRRVTAFVDDEVRPQVHDRDARSEYPKDLVGRLRELELFGACTRSLPTYALAMEEIGRGWLSLVPVVNAHSSSVWTIKNYGTDDQRRHWLGPLENGDRMAALALTEPTGGSDLGNIRSSAVATANGWRITAHKSLITHADHADRLLILARTDGDQPVGHRGLSLFMLDRAEWTVERALPKLGSRSIETCEIRVSDVTVPVDRLVGGVPGRGFAQIMDALEVGRVAVAAAAVGVARAALWNAVNYVREREAFGSRLIEMPVVRARLGACAGEIAAAKALTLSAAAAKQQGGRYDVQTSAAKIAAANSAINTALMGLEVGGGWAYTEDLDFARLLRDSALFIAGEGSNGVLTELIGQSLVKATPSLAWV